MVVLDCDRLDVGPVIGGDGWVGGRTAEQDKLFGNPC